MKAGRKIYQQLPVAAGVIAGAVFSTNLPALAEGTQTMAQGSTTQAQMAADQGMSEKIMQELRQARESIEKAAEDETLLQEARQDAEEALQEAENWLEEVSAEAAQESQEAFDELKQEIGEARDQLQNSDATPDDMAQSIQNIEDSMEDVRSETAEMKPDQDQEQMAKTASAGKTVRGIKLVGTEINSPDGEQVGEIENVLFNEGQAEAVLVDVGGFLGIGEKRVAIPTDKLTASGDKFQIDMTKEEVEGLPEFEDME